MLRFGSSKITRIISDDFNSRGIKVLWSSIPLIWHDWLTDRLIISHACSNALLSSSIPNSSPASSCFRKAVESYEISLFPNEVAYIALSKDYSHHDLISMTQALQQDYEKSIPRLYSRINSVFEKILGFSPVIDVFAQVKSPSCIIWGRCSLQRFYPYVCLL